MTASLSGSSVALPERSSFMLTLCLHELATNATKYGALSNGTGQVHVGWELLDNGSERKAKLSWLETGEPPMTVPQRKGFGSLIERALQAPGRPASSSGPDGA
jgi:two-component sensor histidine kinase